MIKRNENLYKNNSNYKYTQKRRNLKQTLELRRRKNVTNEKGLTKRTRRWGKQPPKIITTDK